MNFIDLFAWPSLVAVCALLTLAWSTAETEKRPVAALAGLGLVLATIVARLIVTSPWPAALAGISLDLGAAFLVTSFYLKRRNRPRKAQFILGLMLLSVSWLTLGAFRLVSSIQDEEPTRQRFASQYIIVELGEDDQIDEIQPVLDRYGARAEKAFPKVGLHDDVDLAQVYLIYADHDLPELMAVLKRDEENVDVATEDLILSHLPPAETMREEPSSGVEYLANDPLISQQWWLEAIGADDVHRLISDLEPEKKAIIGVLDSGVDGRHEDMKAVFGPSPSDTDENGHGTHCAGVAGAPTNNGLGIGSLNWEGRFVEIRGYAVLQKQGMGTSEKLAQGILDATRDGVDVISLSLGAWAPVPPKILVDAVEFALERGVVVIAAAGNSSEDASDHTPSNIEGIISVAAVDNQLRKATFSNTNTALSRPLSAPGVGILSLMPSNAYKALNGTSMATPVVSGLAGLLKALDPSLTGDEIYRLMAETGTSPSSGDNIGQIVNAREAVQSLLDS